MLFIMLIKCNENKIFINISSVASLWKLRKLIFIGN